MLGKSEPKDSPSISPFRLLTSTGPSLSTPPIKKNKLAEALNKQEYFDALFQLLDEITLYLGPHIHNAYKHFQTCAVNLDKNKHVYWLYGAPDGFVLAYSMLKYPFDLIYSASKSDTAKALRACLRSPEGLFLSLTWLASLTLISAYANGISKHKDPASKNVYAHWQAFRDAMKGLRNAHRGIKSSITALQFLMSVDVHYALLPLGLTLGIPSAYNRWWNRHMTTTRKKTMDTYDNSSKDLLNWGRFNDKLTILPANINKLKIEHANSYLLINKKDELNRKLYYINHEGEAEDLGLFSEDIKDFLLKKQTLVLQLDQKHPSVLQWHDLLKKKTDSHFSTFTDHIKKQVHINALIPNQAHKNRLVCYLSAGYGGLVDGLYLFIPFISLVPLAPEALFIVALISAACIFACIITRLQEEYEYDKLLRASEQKAELILGVKTLQTRLARLNLITTKLHSQEHTPEEIAKLTIAQTNANSRVDAAEIAILECYEKLHKTTTISDFEAILIGLRHGINAHGALVCLVFAASLISSTFFATTLPSYIILASIVASVVITAHFIVANYHHGRAHNDKQTKNKNTQIDPLKPLIDDIKLARNTNILRDTANEKIFKEISGTALPTWYQLNLFDIWRSSGSGAMKALKLIDFIITFFFVTFSDASEQHKHDNTSPFVWLVLFPSLIICTMIWTFRAMAKYSTKLDDPLASPRSSPEANIEVNSPTPPPSSSSTHGAPPPPSHKTTKPVVKGNTSGTRTASRA